MKNILNEKPQTKLEGRLKKTFEFLNKEDIIDKKMLDIGCGYGWFEENALKKGAKKIVGAEISESDLSTVKKYIKDKRFTPLVGHALSIDSKDKSFDTVVAWEVIEHIPKNKENDFFKEVHRLLKKNGTFYLSTPFDAPLSTYLDPAYWLIGHRHYTREKLEKFGEKNGFSVEKIIVVGGIWTQIAVLNMYIAKWIFRRKRFFDDFFTKKGNEEYGKKGFHNIFVKYRKI